jgi:hypothetical protein
MRKNGVVVYILGCEAMDTRMGSLPFGKTERGLVRSHTKGFFP